MSCDNCGVSCSRRIKKERVRLFPYPHVGSEWWCAKCYYPKVRNGHSAFWRRYLSVKE